MAERRAAELCGRAERLIGRDEQAAAAELLQQALDADPKSVSAYTLLAWTQVNRRQPPSVYLRSARRAVDLVDSNTDMAVKYFARATYWDLKRDLQQAALSYEAVLAVAPSHYWALNNLADVYWNLYSSQNALHVLQRLATLRPDNAAFQAALGRALFLSGDSNRARPVLRAACDLVRGAGYQEGFCAPWACVAPGYEGLLAGKSEQGEELVRDLLNSRDLVVEERDDILHYGLGVPLGAGHLETGEQWAIQITDDALRAQDLAVIAYLGGRGAQARQLVESITDDLLLESVPIMTDLSLSDTLEHHLRHLRAREDPATLAYVDGELAWSRERYSEAAQHFERSLAKPDGRVPGTTAAIVQTQGLSAVRIIRALSLLSDYAESQGNRTLAIWYLEQVRGLRSFACRGEPLALPFWLKSQVALRRLYTRSGQASLAAGTASALGNATRTADPTFVRWLGQAGASAYETQIGFTRRRTSE
jgi:Tfp pilus assembly protein PilF